MPVSIWTRCKGKSNCSNLTGIVCRATYPSASASTRALVDTDEEQDRLDGMIDRAAAERRALPPGPQYATLHPLLYEPFRFPPLRTGTRFGTSQEQNLWYGAEEPRTALAELAYYRLVFLWGSDGIREFETPDKTIFMVFQAYVNSSAAIDLSAPAFRAHIKKICSPLTYKHSQPLGTAMRADDIHVVRYPSARDPAKGMKVGLFTPEAFGAPLPLEQEMWWCTVTPAADIELRNEEVAPLSFPRGTFLVKGALPTPCFSGGS